MSSFDEKSKNWDSPDKVESAKRLAAAIRKELGERPHSKILEIGCGTGLLGTHFITAKSNYLGVDSSPGMLEKLRAKFPGNEKVRTALLDLDEELPAEGGFDLVLSSMAFHHLASPVVLLTRLSPLLAPGCDLAIVDLDKEDGSFHADPAGSGVKHKGFSEEDVRSWEKSGIKLVKRTIVQNIEKHGRSFPQFLAVLRK